MLLSVKWGNSLPLESYPPWGEGNRQKLHCMWLSPGTSPSSKPVLQICAECGERWEVWKSLWEILECIFERPPPHGTEWVKLMRESQLKGALLSWVPLGIPGLHPTWAPSEKLYRTYLKCFHPRHEKREWEMFTHQLLIPWVRVFPENVNSWIFQVCVGVHIVELFCCGQRRKQKLGNTDEVEFCLAISICSWFPWQQDADTQKKRDRKEKRQG